MKFIINSPLPDTSAEFIKTSRPDAYDPDEMIEQTASALQGLKDHDESNPHYKDVIENFGSTQTMQGDLLLQLNAMIQLNSRRYHNIIQRQIRQAFICDTLMQAIVFRMGMIQYPARRLFTEFSNFGVDAMRLSKKLEKTYGFAPVDQPPISDYSQIKRPYDYIPLIKENVQLWDHLVLQSRDVALSSILNKIGYLGHCRKNGIEPEKGFFDDTLNDSDAIGDDYHHALSSEFSDILTSHRRQSNVADEMMHIGIKAFPAFHGIFASRHDFTIRPKP